MTGPEGDPAGHRDALTSATRPSNVPPMDTMKLLLGATVALLLGALAVSWQGMNTGVKNASPDEIARLERQIRELRAEQDKIQIELLCNLDKVPPVGAVIFCTFPKLKGGTGFPARCFAICPAE